MTMAHDPTRSWPTGKGPGDTSIPGAAWLELLNGQAFPVVGAGAMVWNGTVWVPVSTQNRLPVDAAVSGTVDVSDRAVRQLGTVALSGHLPQPDAPLPVYVHGWVVDEPELVEQLTERDAVGGVLTFTNTIHHVEIFNTDDTNTGTFVVNGIEILMPPGAVFYARIGGTPSNTVTVSGATSYIVGRYV